MSSVGNSYYTEDLEVVEVTTRWRGNIQVKGQWGSATINLGAHPGPLGRWNKSAGESVVAETGIRLKMTHK